MRVPFGKFGKGAGSKASGKPTVVEGILFGIRVATTDVTTLLVEFVSESLTDNSRGRSERPLGPVSGL